MSNVYRVTNFQGVQAGFLVMRHNHCPVAWTPQLSEAQAIQADPVKTLEYTGTSRTFTAKDWEAMSQMVLWPVDRNGRRIGNGRFGCAMFTRLTVDGKMRWAIGFINRNEVKVQKNGIAICNYILGLGRAEDAEAGERNTVKPNATAAA